MLNKRSLFWRNGELRICGMSWVFSLSRSRREILETSQWKSLKKRRSRETGGFSDVVCFYFCAHIKNAQISFEQDLPRLRMTLEYFVRMSETMMRSYFMKGKKQKFGSTLSTVIDVSIIYTTISIELIKRYSYIFYTNINYNYNMTNMLH